MIRISPVKGLGAALTLTAALSAATRPAPAAPVQTYLAIGDSVAFGETDFSQDPSNGDRGYVQPFANFLTAQSGGVAPQVTNLAVDGETSSTFLNGGSPTGNGSPGQPGYSLNTNYSNVSGSQNSLMLQNIVMDQLAGHPVTNVTVQLGANDLFTLLSNPNFLNQSSAQQMAAVGATLQTIQANDNIILGELHSAAPNAAVYMMGYYDPYAADPNSAIEKVAGPAIQALNQVIASEAAANGAKYVDLYNAMQGNELQDTLIAQNANVHPNAAGYALIAAQLENAAVPEPSTVLLFGAGLAGWIALGRRRARRLAD